jgi:hypothetical protein
VTNDELDEKCARLMGWRHGDWGVNAGMWLDADGREVMWATDGHPFERWSPSSDPRHAAMLRERLADDGYIVMVSIGVLEGVRVDVLKSIAFSSELIASAAVDYGHGRSTPFPTATAAECRATAEAFVAALAAKAAGT